MNDAQLLEALRSRVESGQIRPAAVLEALGLSTRPSEGPSVGSRLSTVLYFLGGGIVFMGLAFLIGQQWDHFGPFIRVAVTLGSGIACLVTGVLLHAQQRLGAAASAFFLVSALLLPLGMVVAYDEAGVRLSAMATQVQILGILSAVYLATFGLYRRTVLLVFGIGFATAFAIALTDALAVASPVFSPFHYNSYRILALGASYLFLAHGLTRTPQASLSGWLYGFGAIGLLGSALALGEWKPDQNVFWELAYPGLVFGVIHLSIQERSKTLLVFGSLALGAYLTKITVEYFADSLGWAFALVVVGLLLMGVAYLALQLQRRYVRAPQP